MAAGLNQHTAFQPAIKNEVIKNPSVGSGYICPSQHLESKF